MTEQNTRDSEDPNIKLQSLLTDIDEGTKKLNEKTWRDTILAKTKKVRPSLPLTFYRNDREILGKYDRELEKKWGLLNSNQDEKSYLDFIQVLDDLIQWIITG